MKFQAVESTEDGRLSKYRVYDGNLVYTLKSPENRISTGLRVAIYDNRNEWMTFNRRMFIPATDTPTIMGLGISEVSRLIHYFQETSGKNIYDAFHEWREENDPKR